MPAGTERLSLARAADTPPHAVNVTLPPGKSELVGTFKDNSGVRNVALAVGFVGVVGGGALMLLGAIGDGSEDETTAELVCGGIAVIAGISVGALLYKRDRATITVKPAAAGWSLPRATGIAVTGRL